jgi:hypothetical protein
MASKRQIKANRANATKSTGPKTIAGKARSSRNARRHGLSRWDDDYDLETDALALALSSEPADPSGQVVALDLARARRRLTEIRHIRFKLLLAMIDSPAPDRTKAVAGLARYEKTAWGRVRRGLRCLNTTGGSRSW